MHLFLAYVAITVCLALLFLGDVLGFFGNIDYLRNKEDTAVAFFRLAILKDTRNPLVYLNYANHLIKQGSYTDALTHLKTAHMLDTKEAISNEIFLAVSTCQLGLKENDV